MSVNPERGEVAVSIAGQTYTLRPTFDAVLRIENDLGMETLALWTRVRSGNFGMRTAESVIREGLRAADEKFTGDLREAIFKEGVVTFLKPISSFLGNALNGGKAPEPSTGEAPAGT